MSRRARKPQGEGSFRRLTRFSAADLLMAAALLTACAALVYMLPADTPTPAPAPVLTGAARAVDGDSVRLDGANIRLAGIDAPELRQTCVRHGKVWNCGEAARIALAAELARGAVACAPKGRDRYQRILAVCSVGGKDLNGALVREGLAISYGAYEREEAEARAARRGVWAGEFETPQNWRRQHPRN